MMLYRISIVSDEIENFLREITISAEDTFFDLHKAILSSCDYPDDQLTSFFLCDEEWEQKTQITREDMGFGPSDEDIYVMADTRLSELLEEEKQRLIYVFDPMSDRCFYMELTEIIIGKTLQSPLCNKSYGNPPQQLLEMDFSETKNAGKSVNDMSNMSDEEFYGSDGFESDEFDPEGFEISDEDTFRN